MFLKKNRGKKVFVTRADRFCTLSVYQKLIFLNVKNKFVYIDIDRYELNVK